MFPNVDIILETKAIILMAFFCKLSLNFFIDVEYDINPDTADFTFINSILRDVEQKGRMNLERMKYYEGREKLSDYEIEIDSDDN